MKEFLSKRLKQFKNLLSTKKFKIRKIRSIAIVLIATITFTTLGSNFVYAKNNEVYERNLIAANNDPSVIEAIQNNREVYNSSKIDKFVVADNYMTYATILGKNGAVFFDGTDHLNEAGQCKDGCKAMIATATFIRGTKPGTEEAKYCISYYIACLNCSRNKAQQIGLESYTNPSEKERLSNNSKELKGLFNGMDKYFAEHPEESPIPKINVPKDVINKIKSNRKFVLDNGIFVKENGQNVTANASVEDAIDVNENGICNSGNHRRTYDHYTHKGADLLVRHGCFNCLYESFKVVPKSEYDTLEKRIKLANDSVRIKQFFIDNGLSFEEKDKIVRVPELSNIKKCKVVKPKNNNWYQINTYSNNIVEVITEKSGVPMVVVTDTKTGNMELKIFSDKTKIYNVKVLDSENLKLTDVYDGAEQIINKDNLGSLQADPLTLTLASKELLIPALIIMVPFLSKSLNNVVDVIIEFINTTARTIKDVFNNAVAILKAQTMTQVEALAYEISEAIDNTDRLNKKRDKTIYVEVAIDPQTSRVYLPKSLLLTKEEAKKLIRNGKNILTPLQCDAEELSIKTSGSDAYITDPLGPSNRKQPDVPHYYGKVNKKNRGIRDKKIKYDDYEQQDSHFANANLHGFFGHYHPVGYGHEKNEVGPGNPHIMYIGSGEYSKQIKCVQKVIEKAK